MLRNLSLVLLFVTGGLVFNSEAARAESLDLSAWQHIPVYQGGRIMPLDTFARESAQIITHREQPKLGLKGYYSAGELDAPEMAGARELFAQAETRKFQAAELLLSWLAEPEKWELVPFLYASDAEVRKVLDVPLKAKDGTALKYVSPAQVADSDALRQRLSEIDARRRQATAKGEKFEFVGSDKSFAQLLEAYNRFRALTFNPMSEGETRSRFLEKANAAVGTWQKLDRELQMLLHSGGGESEFDQLVQSINASLDTVATVAQKLQFGVAEVEPAVVTLVASADRLARHLAERRDSSLKSPPESWSTEQVELYRRLLNRLAVGARQFAKYSHQMHLGLYDTGNSLRVAPALDAAALEKDRDTTDDAQPWLTLQTVLVGSKDLLRDYPQEPVAAVRKNFAALVQAYRDRELPNRADTIEASAVQLAQSLRVLGSELEPARQQLPIQGRDEALVAYTAYPSPGYTDHEVHYNQTDPFRWSWMISLAALLCFALSFGVIRKPMFWLGMLVLTAGLIWTAYGFYLRVRVTGWAPVTNMYETVIYVPLFVSLLAAWFVLLPLTWRGIKAAWRLTAAPLTWEATELSADERSLWPEWVWKAGGVAALVPRVLLMRLMFETLARKPYAAGERTIINLSPTAYGAEALDFNNLLTWFVGICVLIPTVWYVPRLVMALALSLVTIPAGLRGHWRQAMQQSFERRAFGLAGTFVAFLGSFVAWYSPVLDGSFGPLMPVLRDNFWLTIHVLTIVSSYGAGALAWGLGNLALLYYLFGKYRAPVAVQAAGHRPAGASDEADEGLEPVGKRPPEECASLATFTYKSMQVAVLLLAAGTILGGLWADVSWGRFWGWDPKEVWALVSLLTYIAILHGRYAGLFGNFGLAAGAVMGASAIIFSWYGVNFVLGVGLHSYGFGTGGQYEVASAVGLNWLLLGAAGWRYWKETSTPVGSDPPTPAAPRLSAARREPIEAPAGQG